MRSCEFAKALTLSLGAGSYVNGPVCRQPLTDVMEYRALLSSLEDKVTCVEMGERSSVGLYRETSPRRVVSEDDICLLYTSDAADE